MCVILLGFLLFVGYSQAVDVASCSNGNETTMSFTPSNDGIVGRYLAEWCINVHPISPPPTEWTLQLKFFRNNNYCENLPKGPIYSQGVSHSYYQESIAIDWNCSHVCLNTTVDLVFSDCYLLKTSFLINNLHRNITDAFFLINNTHTEEEFLSNTAQVNSVCHDGENVTSEWHTGVPFESFELDLWEKIPISLNETRLVKVPVYPNCTAPSDTVVKCQMRLWPGVFHTQLHLHAPWKHGVFMDQDVITYDIVVDPVQLTEVTAWSAWPWALGALIAVVALGLATHWACRTREARALQKSVLKHWPKQGNQSTPVAPVRPQMRYILLLYARECHLGDQFCAALRDMLQEEPGVKVYDIFSTEVIAMAASGPHEWVRGMLARDDVAVLLLQTPAVAALYQRHLHDADNAVRLQEPLLGHRLLYREPQYGDMLLQYAVMLIAESAPSWNNYHKYYVANLTELPTEIFQQLVPYRRYSLPGAAPLLAQSICGLAPSPPALSALAVAARAFVDLATDEPGYLMEQLIRLP